MQSDLSKLTPKTLPKESSDLEQTRQHGLNTQNEYSSGFLHSGAILDKPSCSPLTTGSAAIMAANPGDFIDEQQRLSPKLSPSQLPVDRISEHEKALAYTPRRRNEGPKFVVIPGTMAKTKGEINITDFPNGEIDEIQAL